MVAEADGRAQLLGNAVLGSVQSSRPSLPYPLAEEMKMEMALSCRWREP